MTREEELRNTLEDLREDVMLLDLALLGARASVDKDILACLLRLCDYLKQHVGDICSICGQ